MSAWVCFQFIWRKQQIQRSSSHLWPSGTLAVRFLEATFKYSQIFQITVHAIFYDCSFQHSGKWTQKPKSPARQVQEGAVKQQQSQFCCFFPFWVKFYVVFWCVLPTCPQNSTKFIKKDDLTQRSNSIWLINLPSHPLPLDPVTFRPQVHSQISLVPSQIQQFYIVITLLLSSTTMIDSTFGHPLPASPGQEEVPVAVGEWELFSAGRTEAAVLSELYQNSIILNFYAKQGKEPFKVPLDFDLKFQLLREKAAEKGTWSMEDIFAIRFQKGEHSFELRHPKESGQLALWREHLTRRINQLGFHQLFRPLKEIGRGAFASVYLVQSNENGRQYAVKAFSKQSLAAEENGLKGLRNEIEIMRSCSHRNLMKMQGVYESRNSLYLCVELLSGGQLYDLIKAKHKFTSQQIRAVMRALLSGVEAMHAKGYMHRDLKPENVLFRENGGECVIADFGLAESAGGELMFVRCGTPGYVAPQIVNLKNNKAAYSTACDLFSLGVIFHILALGKSPFPGKTFDQVLEQNKSCKLNFDTFEYNQLPTSWLSLLKGLLEKDPKKRLTASQALAHEFFRKEPLIARLQKEKERERERQREKENRQPRAPLPDCNSPLQRDKKVSIECNSPLMLTRNHSRKTPGLLRDDSCLKFKMKEAIMTGKIEEGRELPPISPLLKQKQPAAKPFESRFKQIAQQNS